MLGSQVHASTPEFYLGSGYWTQALVLVLWALCSWLSSPSSTERRIFFKKEKSMESLKLAPKGDKHSKFWVSTASFHSVPSQTVCHLPVFSVTRAANGNIIHLPENVTVCHCDRHGRKTLQCATGTDTGSFWSLTGLSLSHLETNSLRRLFLCFKQGLLFCPPGRPVLLL